MAGTETIWELHTLSVIYSCCNKQFSRQQQHVEGGEGGAQVECSDVAHMGYCQQHRQHCMMKIKVMSSCALIYIVFFFSIKILALIAKDTQYSCTIANFACMPKG